ncbi:class IV adenylate cyclase [Aquincola sp. MAHUQ-54]|uniref:Class IV adenylate cyclase n=1 Tax=Aquincola agrisoli TaxID=3119538 RepID=A0AAW9QLY7_9BURK
MARNIEIKARIASVQALLPRAQALADSPEPVVIDQDDTFFACAAGRLKLRQFTPNAGELIHYHRADVAGPKLSDYVRVPTAEPALLREALRRAHGEAGRVRKRRLLLTAGATRIHLDAVEGLGDFLELEVVLRDDEAPGDGEAVARALLRGLGIADAQLLQGAYVDLLRAGAA